MNIEGTFTTPAATVELRSLFASPEGLEQVPTLRDVRRDSEQVLSMIFTPRLALGPVPLFTTVTTVSEGDELVELAVVGSRGTQSVAVTLAVALAPGEAGTTVGWSADVVVRGGVASVGQRVVGDLVAKAIGDVLAASAAVAAAGAAAGSPA